MTNNAMGRLIAQRRHKQRDNDDVRASLMAASGRPLGSPLAIDCLRAISVLDDQDGLIGYQLGGRDPDFKACHRGLASLVGTFDNTLAHLRDDASATTHKFAAPSGTRRGDPT